ncbi:glucosyltransferase [Scheffersomyces amazonensis]|uniref:glucosyltransferase n=1 Tax=Scheffersomyces amazonensis TaxID=1078765 RepID=UPI00315C8707
MPLIVADTAPVMVQLGLKYLAIILFVIFAGYVRHLVTIYVQDPYIDEIFHLRQCQKYLDYKFYEWDDKITTPPGLYLLGFIYSKVIEILSFKQLNNNYEILRSLNLVGGLFILPIIVRTFKKSFDNQLWTINLISQPLLFTYYFLFYTDVWSTILILGSLSLVINKPHTIGKVYLSALLVFFSLWFRQTNIVWSAFIVSVLIDRSILLKRNEHINSITRIIKFIIQTIKDWIKIIPFIINFVLFIIFIKINGGITFGDKENHEVNFHVVQVFYCFVFTIFFTWPVWLSSRIIIKYIKFLIINNYGLNIVFNALALYIIKYIIDNFTVIHPFLLADNRHYTFYIFKRLISHKYSQFITIPLYHFSSFIIVTALLESKRIKLSFITIISYFIAILLTIVPSPLFEPRYYILPVIIFRLFISPGSRQRHFREFLWLNTINIITAYIFFTYEFTWASEPGIIQRIIW